MIDTLLPCSQPPANVKPISCTALKSRAFPGVLTIVLLLLVSPFVLPLQGMLLGHISSSNPSPRAALTFLKYWGGGCTLLATLIGGLIFAFHGVQDEGKSRKAFIWAMMLVVASGTAIRLYLAYEFYGNYDTQSNEIIADIARRGGNAYAETYRYNQAPPWSLILGALKHIQLHFPSLPFHFVIRAFLTGIDLLTLAVLLALCDPDPTSRVRTAVLFYLNPVSILITGYHGQFENITILLLLTGALLTQRLRDRPFLAKALLWAFATFAMILKHNVFYELIVCIKTIVRSRWAQVALMAVSSAIFLALFIPYWDQGSQGIVRNVLLYSSTVGPYGVSSLCHFPFLKYVFIAALFVFPYLLRGEDLIRKFLVCVLFFLVFTTGIGEQYFVLPIAFGALRPSKGALVFTVAAGMFLLGSPNNVNLTPFSYFSFNLVWLGAVYWFVAEISEVSIVVKFKAMVAGLLGKRGPQEIRIELGH